MIHQAHQVPATLLWRRFPDGAVVYDSRHGRTHLLSTAAADVLEALRIRVDEKSIGADAAQFFAPISTNLAASSVDAREVEEIVAELLRLGLISSRATEIPALASESAAADTSS